MSPQEDFYTKINQRALRVLPALLERWLPEGKQCGQEYFALNPKRHDQKIGSFKINTQNGKWADFATDDRGGDVVSLVAYLHNITRKEAIKKLLKILKDVK